MLQPHPLPFLLCLGTSWTDVWGLGRRVRSLLGAAGEVARLSVWCRRSISFRRFGGPLRYGKGMPKISSKHQITLPVETLERAGLSIGDEVTIEAEGVDRIIVRRVLRDAEQALGVFDGLYEPDYLEQLRSGERA